MNEFNWQDCHAAYINLKHRADREKHMRTELKRVGLTMQRFEAIKTTDYKWDVEKVGGMVKRGTLGAIGCHYSQVSVMAEALKNGKHAWVNEDDLIFCDDIHKRLDYVSEFLNNQESWDIWWGGATYHIPPIWHKSHNGKHTHPDLQMCNCKVNKDWEPTDDKYIIRTYGAFSTYSYIVNHKSIDKILTMLDNHVSISMGIDFLFILLQPQLKTFAFNPGCVKQMDNQSDIGKGITRFSGFAKSCGPHYFSKKVF